MCYSTCSIFVYSFLVVSGCIYPDARKGTDIVYMPLTNTFLDIHPTYTYYNTESQKK